MRQEISNISNQSSIHGIRYIFDSTHSKFTRFFWTFSFLFSICGFCFYLHSSYVKTFVNPDFDTRVVEKSARDIPFPAISVCTQLYARDKLFDIRDYFKIILQSESHTTNLSESECEYFSANAHWCLDNYAEYSKCDDDPERIIEFMDKSSLSVEEFLVACTLSLNFQSCTKIFNKILTYGYGVCYTYNMQGFDTIFNEEISKDFYAFKNIQKNSNDSHWTLDAGYKTNQEIIFPARALNFNHLNVIGILKNIDAENFCDLKALTITFHLPNEIQTPFHRFHLIPYGKLKIFDLTAKSFSAEKDLKKFKPKYRKCYFKGEKKLKFFKSYTKNHCELECMTNFTLKTCGCVKFSMPRENSTKICRLRDAKCYFKITSRYPNIGNKTVNCDCLSSCNDIKYSVQSTSESTYDDWSEISHLNLNASELIIFRGDFNFPENTIEDYESFVAYKLQNFIADFGGLLGLFMGCSVLSIVEIFYAIFAWCGNNENKNSDAILKSNQIFVSPQKILRKTDVEEIPQGLFEYRN